MRIARRAVTAGLGMFPFLLEPASAREAWPSRPLRIIVPFAPGGPVELPARFIAEALRVPLGQPIIVETRPGAGGALGVQAVVQANDPHVLLLTTSSVAIAPAMMRDPGYDPLRDLVPISIVTDTPMVILAKPDGRIRDLADVVARGKAEPGRVSYATTGVGSTTHLAGSLLCVRAAIDLLHVPYRGSAPAATAIYAGDVDLLLTGSVEALPHIRSGRLKAIAVTGAQRMALLPDVPAIAEQVTGYSMTIWYAMFGPGSTPPPVVERMARELERLATGSSFAKRMEESGATVRLDGPAPLAERLRLEVPQWREVIAAAGISAT